MQLLACLQTAPLRTLWALCQANGFACDRRLPKAALAAALHARLLERTSLAFLNRLPAEQRSLLLALAQEPQPLSLDQFQARFGALRPYRPWRSDAPPHPWRAPISTAETLFYQGLIFIIPLAGQPPHVLVPAEIANALRRPTPAPLPLAPPPPIPHTLLDLALLLAYLQQADVRPLHSRWLSPQHCRRLGECLAPPLSGEPLPSQRHNPRLAFAHYLAERLGLLTLISGYLKPSPAAAGWLEQSLAQQIQACWQVWLTPDDANRSLWQRFHLPGHTLRDPVGFTLRLLQRLPAPAWGDLSDLLPWWEREQGSSAAQQHVADLLAGPLAGLGVITDPAHPALTSVGAWLILGHDQPALATPQPLVGGPQLTLALPADAPPPLSALLLLAAWAELAPGPRWRITPPSLARALSQANALSGLRGLWQRFVAPPLDPAQEAQLQAWVERQRWIQLQPALLLRTSTSAELDALLADRSLRSHWGQRLSSDLVSVRSAEPARLRRALVARGYSLRTPLPVDNTGQADPEATPSAGNHWWLYTSSLLHRLLAEQLGLPMPPGATLAALQAELDPAQQEAAQNAAAAIMAALQRAVEGPPDPPATLPMAQTEARLLAAIADEASLHLVYWSPWYNAITQRCVRPLQLQWRGDHRYLIAHCHTANAQRTFRLDRIIDLSPCSPSS